MPIRRSRALAAAVTGAALGFLVWNWSPARIFLGDVGSVPLGYLLGFLLLDRRGRGHWKIALILPLYFLADATMTLRAGCCAASASGRRIASISISRPCSAGSATPPWCRRVIAADLVLIGCGWAAENGLGCGSRSPRRAATVAILLAALARGVLRLAASCPTRRPISAADDAQVLSPDPPRADLGQRQERASCRSPRALAARGVALISTGGSAQALAAAGLAGHRGGGGHRLSRMLDGRVKTLHPAIHGGLLARRDRPDHLAALADARHRADRPPGLQPLPLRRDGRVGRRAARTASRTSISAAPALIRAAAKNHEFVAVVTDPADYDRVLAEMAPPAARSARRLRRAPRRARPSR